jgi:hypothetical protein
LEVVKTMSGKFSSSPRGESWFRAPGANSITLYLAVFTFFAVGSFYRDSNLFWIPLLAGFAVAVLFRMNLTDLLIVALPFHFVLDLGFRGTLTLAHLVLPSALLYELLRRPKGQAGLERNRQIQLLALWLASPLVGSAIAGLNNQIDILAFLVGFSKLTISVLFAVWVIAHSAIKSSLWPLLKIFVWVSVGVALIGFASNFVYSFFGFRTSFFYAESRLMAPFENPNHFAFHMLVATLFALSLSLFNRGRVYLALALFLLYSTVAADSQAGHVALLFVATLGLIIFGFERRFLLKQSVFAMSTYLFLALQYISFPRRLNPLNQTEPPATVDLGQFERDGRWQIWSDLIETWSRSPWFGRGFGQSGGTGHSTPITFLVDSGIILTLVALIIFSAVLWRGFLCDELSRMMTTISVGLAVFGLGNDVHNIATFWIVIALVAVLPLQSRSVLGAKQSGLTSRIGFARLRTRPTP